MEKPAQPLAHLPDYYRKALSDEDALSSIRDLDDFDTFKDFEQAVSSARTRNFIVDFSDEQAWAALNLNADNFEDLLEAPRPHLLNTRWINIWLPHDQRDTVEVLAKHYDFSPRLLGMMLSRPSKVKTESAASSRLSSERSLGSQLSNRCSESSTLDNSILDDRLECEDKIADITMEDLTRADLARNLNQYVLADDIWHYSSVDWGRRYMCMGYNTLHVVASDPNKHKHDRAHEDRPYGKRVWSWLLLGENRTIVTVSEDPFPRANGTLTFREQRALGTIRRNMIHIFRQCSKAYVTPDEFQATQLPIRRRVGDTEEEAVHRAVDVPGLLFYYLFDDSLGTYSLIARRQNRYAMELNQIRLSMLSKAELGHIDRLHHIGRQLSALKRIYQGYDMIIDRLLEKREPSLASLKASQAYPHMDDSPAASQGQLLNDAGYFIGVSVSSAAKVRFERLKHNIKLYAISEIEECLAQKDALVMMNFNLIAIKESFSVERLTRVTLLLGKATILFMPISVMSAYFSCQLVDAEFTVRSYWSWFAGIFAASIFGLMTFSMVSGTFDAEIIYKPLSRRVLDFGMGFYRSLRSIKPGGDDEE